MGALAERGRRAGRETAERFTLDDLPPASRGLLLGDVVAAGTPILLVHGLVDNRSVFTLLRRALRRRRGCRSRQRQRHAGQHLQPRTQPELPPSPLHA